MFKYVVGKVSRSVAFDSLLPRGSKEASSVHGILQARILEWVAIPSPGDIPHPGVETGSPALQADSLPLEPPGKPKCLIIKLQNAVRETKPDLSKRRNRQIHNHTWSFKRPVGTSQDLFDCCTTFGMGRQRVGSHVKW